MFCPYKFNSSTMEGRELDNAGGLTENICQCEKSKCELWEEFTGTCSHRTLAYLKGVEVARGEARPER